MRQTSVLLCLLYFLVCCAAAQDGPRLRQGFERLDANKDGQLSATELKTVPRLESRLEGADLDNDGLLSFREFAGAIARSMRRPAQPEEAGGAFGAGDRTRTIDVEGQERRYRIHVPPNYTADRKTPVVVAFHGGGGNPQSMIRLSGLNEKADDAGFVVVYPFGSGTDKDKNLTFNAGNVGGYAKRKKIDDVGFTKALLGDLEAVVNVDKERVFATGISNGGMMAYRVASELADRFAAIAPVGGPMGTETCTPSRPVSVIHFHGTADELAPFKGGKGKGSPNVPAFLRPEFFSVDHSIQAWVKANGCGPVPRVQKLPDVADDGMQVVRKTWGNGRDGSEVVLIKIEGGGHTWPGQNPPVAFLGKSTKDISANDLMWEFFQKNARKADSPQSKQKAPENGAMELLRTPDEHFANLRGYPFEPRYLYVDDPNLPDGNRRIRMHYAVSGPANRPTLLMLHGNPSWSYLFRKVVPLINEAGYRTIRIDYVGHGKSDKPAKESDYTYDRHLEWIRQAFKQLDEDPELALKEVVLFGHDYGHPLGARLMAEHYPDRFDGFINGNAGLNRGRWGIAKRHDRWRSFVRSVPKVPIGAVVFRNDVRQNMGLPPGTDAEKRGYDAPYPTGDYQASIRAFPEMVPEDATWPEAKANQKAWDFLTSSYDRPYLVIWESMDMPDVQNRRDEYISSTPGAFGLEQPQFRTGHYSPEDDPEGVAGAVIRFLNDIYIPNQFDEIRRATFTENLEGFACEGNHCSLDPEKEAVRMTPGSQMVHRETIDLSSSEELKIAFRYLPEGVASGGTLFVDLWSDGDWVNLREFERGYGPGRGDFNNRSTDYGYIRVEHNSATFSTDAKVRFRFACEDEKAAIFIKEVGIYRKTRRQR
ncbi:Haloalkane dehalogenase [Sedimentisphaera cyanobacteriorum]|uniref:Haloalkane dehalogenase n=1 Tax=Sedimentisphaera cyanobacteriorum TaxID=1940790 RepID=A0A1Q2HRI1_9BACT|nr:alpha/beta fold hydrolase [Sedimentisphaera cyanobacteriorum]AQQ09833.1 Haloalkane dehalogenase [Sedimentisphaera cyanobacteriorum]